MAEYTFGENILRYVQNQDELNLRVKALQTEEERYKAEQSFQQRQAQLVQTRWNTEKQVKAENEAYQRDKDFKSSNVFYDAVPEEIKGKVDKDAITYYEGKPYVSNEIVTNLETARDDELNALKETNAQEQLKITNANEKQRIGISAGSLEDTKRYHDYLMSKDGSDKKQVANEKIYSTNLALANDNLAKLKAFNSKGKDSNLGGKDYAKFKGDGTKAVGKLLTVVGLSNSDLDYVREGALLDDKTKNDFKLAKQKADKDSDWARSNEWAQTKREFYNSAIYSLEDKITDGELEVLKLWNDVGTR